MSKIIRVLNLLASCFLSCVRCEVFDLSDEVPWLVVGGKRVSFSSGWDSFVVADSSCIRVNSRGVYAKPSHWRPRELSKSQWATIPCAPGSAGGLCHTGSGVVFPHTQPLYNASASWGGMRCSRPQDGRLLNSAYGYDVSACDVLDDGGDAVFCGRSLSYARTGLVEGVYWALCLLAVYIVRSLSYLVVTRLSSSDSHESFWVDFRTVLACFAVLPLSLIPLGDSGFVTEEEVLFYDFLCVYCVLYFILFALHTILGKSSDPPIYNLIAATLQIIACRLYLSAETPYNPVIVWAVATRAFTKLRSRAWGEFVLGASTVADSCLLALMCVIAFDHNKLYLVVVASLSLATSDTLFYDSSA